MTRGKGPVHRLGAGDGRRVGPGGNDRNALGDSLAASTCGKPHCACKAHPPKLHGVYYRWTGFLQSQRTTKTLSKELVQECQNRIKNYRKFQRQIEKILAQALAEAPWNKRNK